MPERDIREAIEERLCKRWRQFCIETMAAPVCVVAIGQLAGPDYGIPVVTMVEDMDELLLADLLEGVAKLLRRGCAAERKP